MSNLDLLIDQAYEAGKVATTFVGGALDVRHKADNAGPVTAADLAVNQMLEENLRGARPDYGWLSEESEDSTARLAAKDVFIVDPIDGTRSFIEGQDTWAHSLAIATDGIITAAVVYLPMLDRLYAAETGKGATLNGEPIHCSDAPHLETARILTTAPNMKAHHWRGDVPNIKRSHRPSLAYRLSLVAQGRFDAMFTFRESWEWDIAAGALILEEAGALATDKKGMPLRFNNQTPLSNGVVAGGPSIHRKITARLA